MTSDFRISVITDEISQDFEHSLDVAKNEFGMDWVELRTFWNKNIMDLDSKDIAETRRLLEHYQLRVSDLGTPLFKVDWPEAPLSKARAEAVGDSFNADFAFKQQSDVLDRAIELARVFRCDRLRGFDFWRLDDPSPYRKDMDQMLIHAADKCGQKGIVFVLENEYECNSATGPEASRTLNGVRSPHFMLNWDPGNAAMRGDIPFPDSYERLPKDRIGHVHCKDVTRKEGGLGFAWSAMGQGIIDWTGQFRALKRDGYRRAVSLETHWRGAGSAEESSRQSWAGMKQELLKSGVLS
jgi:sugar phosphate isomerase/epimerase